MKIELVIHTNIEPTSVLGKILREKALIIMQARKSKQENPDLARPDLKAAFDALTPEADAALKAFLPFADYQLMDVRYDSEDVISKQEEAILLAPPG